MLGLLQSRGRRLLGSLFDGWKYVKDPSETGRTPYSVHGGEIINRRDPATTPDSALLPSGYADAFLKKKENSIPGFCPPALVSKQHLIRLAPSFAPPCSQMVQFQRRGHPIPSANRYTLRSEKLPKTRPFPVYRDPHRCLTARDYERSVGAEDWNGHNLVPSCVNWRLWFHCFCSGSGTFGHWSSKALAIDVGTHVR
jgi:hypothetical protein